MTISRFCAAVSLAAALSSAGAQTPQPPATPNPITASQAKMYTMLSGMLVQAAEKVPEDTYSYRPTDGVRTFGQIVGHLSDSQAYFCSLAAGETKSSGGVEKNKTSKADLIAALKEANEYCRGVYARMTDAKGAEMVKLMGNDFTRLTVLAGNTAHLYEHYGNMSTYMRMKGIVPPTSERPPEPVKK